MRTRTTLVVLLVATVVATLPPLSAGTAAASSDDQGTIYRPPVDAPIVDRFHPPASRYGAGNRGVEYATMPGAAVRAVAGGEVVFAGQVGGALHVTVRHADGLRSSYSYLASIAVARGHRVQGGDVVGTAGRRVHLGIRDGDAYLDPEAVLAGARHPRLVPVGDLVGDGMPGEAAALVEIMRRSGSSLRPDRVIGWLRGEAGDVTGVLQHAAGDLVRFTRTRTPFGPVIELGRALHDVAGITISALVTDTPCTAAGTRVGAPVGRRMVVLVGGLGSTSTQAAVDEVDVASLGYEAADVVRFSYAGGRIPDPTDSTPGLVARPYDRDDSQRDLAAAGALLAATLTQLARELPGVPIDVIGHSQGGVVARVALAQLDRRHRLPAAVDLVATLGSPHRGAPLASAAEALANRIPAGSLLVPIAGASLDLQLTTRQHAPRQLATGSALLDTVPDALPPSVRGVSIAARTDAVVPPVAARLGGATNVVLSTSIVRAHADLPGHPATTRALLLALGGRPPACESRVDRVLDALVGGGLQVGERVAVVASASLPLPL